MNTVTPANDGQGNGALPWLPGRIYRHRHDGMWIATERKGTYILDSLGKVG